MESSDGERPSAARRVLEAAIKAIDAGGEVAVRVQDIADVADVQVPILYRHFVNRDGLIQAAQLERISRTVDDELEELSTAISQIATLEQFRALVDAILGSLVSDERRTLRWQRANVIGSTYGRPALAAEVAKLQSRAIKGIAMALRHPQESGWLRDGLDAEAFAAWFAGQTLGRILIELGDTGVGDAAWNSISRDAVRHVLLG
jgi:AcrR family transcriptional regulator